MTAMQYIISIKHVALVLGNRLGSRFGCQLQTERQAADTKYTSHEQLMLMALWAEYAA